MLPPKRRLRKRLSSGCGIVEEALAWAVLQQAAAVEEGHGVAGVAGETHLVGDDDEAGAGFLQVAHHVEHLGGEFRVQGARGLVEQQQARPGRERPGYGDALLLAAGQLSRPLGRGIGQAEAFQQIVGAVGRFGIFHAVHHAQGQRHVLLGGEVVKQAAVLEDEAEGRAVVAQRRLAGGHGDAVHGQVPPVGTSRPPIMRKSVDFPPPDGPIMARADTSSSKVMSCSTSVPSKAMER